MHIFLVTKNHYKTGKINCSVSYLNSENIIAYIVGERLAYDTKGNIYHLPQGLEIKIPKKDALAIVEKLLKNGGIKGPKYADLVSNR